MQPEGKRRRHYCDVLDHLKTYFPPRWPIPPSWTVISFNSSRGLDPVDGIKSAMPSLSGGIRTKHDGENPKAACPTHMESVEEVTGSLADYCRGMTIWYHPNGQVDGIPAPTISSITAVIRYANDPAAPAIAAPKSFIMSPWTDLDGTDAVVNQMMGVVHQSPMHPIEHVQIPSALRRARSPASIRHCRKSISAKGAQAQWKQLFVRSLAQGDS
jgi:hypothetical protein